MRNLAYSIMAVGLVGCSAPTPDRVQLTLAPDVISSESGTLAASAKVLDGDRGLDGWTVKLHVDYADRNDAAHAVDDASNVSDTTGLVAGSFQGLKWEGAGTVTAAVFDKQGNAALDAKKNPITTQATFSVLDETPPAVMITSPASGATVSRANGSMNVGIAATDEIGVSQVYVQVATANGNTNLDRTRSTIATGSTTAQGSFGFDVGNVNAGTTVTIYAMAADMTGNLGVAAPITITVGP